jgi:hypothetical protein
MDKQLERWFRESDGHYKEERGESSHADPVGLMVELIWW